MQRVKEIDKRLDSNINFRVVKFCHEIMSRVRGWTYNARIEKYCTSNAFIYILIMRNHEEVKSKKGQNSYMYSIYTCSHNKLQSKEHCNKTFISPCNRYSVHWNELNCTLQWKFDFESQSGNWTIVLSLRCDFQARSDKWPLAKKRRNKSIVIL